MIGVLRAVARFFQETIGWNRIGVLLSITIISVAVVVLYHMLQDINVDEVVAARPNIVRRAPNEKELQGWIDQSKKLSKVVEH